MVDVTENSRREGGIRGEEKVEGEEGLLTHPDGGRGNRFNHFGK